MTEQERDRDVCNSKVRTKSSKSFVFNEAIRYEVSNSRGDEKVKYLRRKSPVVIDLRIFIYSIENINTLRQEMLCEFLLSANWFESLSWFNKTHKDSKEMSWNGMWDPRLYFPNAVDMRTSLNKTVAFVDTVKERVMIQWSYRVKGRFKCPFNITMFPFDEQLLSIHVSSYWSDTTVKLKQETTIGNNIKTALSTFTDCGQWELQKYILSDVVDPKESTSSSEIKEPLFQFHVHARRKYKYYLWNIAAMVNMISILAFTSFAIDRSDIGKRLSVSLTLLLTVVAFKNFVSSVLPKVSYLTLLDKYVLFNVAFIFLVAIENAIVGKVPKLSQEQYDSVFLLVSIIAYVLFQSVFLIMSVRAVKRSRAKFCERFVGEFSVVETLKRATEILKLPVRNDSGNFENSLKSTLRSTLSSNVSLVPKFLTNGNGSLLNNMKPAFHNFVDSPRISTSHTFDEFLNESESDNSDVEEKIHFRGVTVS